MSTTGDIERSGEGLKSKAVWEAAGVIAEIEKELIDWEGKYQWMRAQLDLVRFILEGVANDRVQRNDELPTGSSASEENALG